MKVPTSDSSDRTSGRPFFVRPEAWKQERPAWCPHQDCVFCRRSQDALCGGRLPKPEPHDGDENTHRFCINADGVFPLQVNKTDLGYFRWIFDALDGETTSWLSKRPDAAPPEEGDVKITEDICGNRWATGVVGKQPPPSDAAIPKASLHEAAKDVVAELDKVNKASVTEADLDRWYERLQNALDRAAPPSDAAPVAWGKELNAIGNVLGAVVSGHKAHIGLSGDCYTPQIRATHAKAACKALKSLREYVAAHPEDAPRITMTKSYLSGRQCCDFTIAEDDSETHAEGCPWRIVDEFSQRVLGHVKLLGTRFGSVGWIERQVCELVEDITSSPIRHPEDAPGGPTDAAYEAADKAWMEWLRAGRGTGFESVRFAIRAAYAVDALDRLKGDET